MSSTSLGAYAAWLAKRESKARRRSVESTSESSEAEVSEGPASAVVRRASGEGPYAKWAKRKETKLPLVRVVAASPDSIEVIAGEAPAASAKSSRVGVGVTKIRTSEPSNKINGQESSAKQGKKRAAPAAPLAEQTAKKQKPSQGTEAAKKTSEKDAPRAERGIATASTQSKPKPCRLPVLPKIEEVRYWQDVDRFSFLA